MSLSAIQNELKVPKTEYNSFGKYNYRTAEGILEAVKPLLQKYGMYLLLTDEIIEKGNRYYIESTTRLYHEKDLVAFAKGFAREEETKKGMDAAQITGSASSYARKYALCGLFAIADSDDPDKTKDNDMPDLSKITMDDTPQKATKEQWERFKSISDNPENITKVKNEKPELYKKCGYINRCPEKITKIQMDEVLEELDAICIPF